VIASQACLLTRSSARYPWTRLSPSSPESWWLLNIKLQLQAVQKRPGSSVNK
jgi:hypothetical protein